MAFVGGKLEPIASLGSGFALIKTTNIETANGTNLEAFLTTLTGQLTVKKAASVSALPTGNDIDANSMYLVPVDPSDETNHHHYLYMYISSEWAIVGSTEINEASLQGRGINALTIAESGEYEGYLYATFSDAPQTPVRIGNVPIVGKDGRDGTSINIKTSLTAPSSLPTTGAEIGDTYVIDGMLWVYDGNANTTDQWNATTNPTGKFYRGFQNVGGFKGDKGDTGDTPTITMTASVDANVGTPAVSVIKTGTDDAPSFVLAFTNMKGETGATGAEGATWILGTALTGTTTVSGSVSGSKAGDLYMNTSTFNVYQASEVNSAISWTYVGCLMAAVNEYESALDTILNGTSNS